jgi:hypothetical protein
LLDYLRRNVGAYRTWQLEDPPERVLRAANLGRPKRDGFRRLRVVQSSQDNCLSLEVEGDMLVMTVGQTGSWQVSAAFNSLSAGQGDFGFTPEGNQKSDHWMFWWILTDYLEKKP